MKIRSTMEEDEVTVWLPLSKGWPVISLAIVDETTQRLLWAMVHESFKESAGNGDGTIELTITRLSAIHHNTDTPVARTIEETPLRYGIAPNGMRQTVPRGSTPLPLCPGSQYLAVVRETVEDNFRWFGFTAEETRTK